MSVESKCQEKIDIKYICVSVWKLYVCVCVCVCGWGGVSGYGVYVGQ